MGKVVEDFSMGDIVKAKSLYSWTLHEFDDFPLVVNPGDIGVIVDIDHRKNIICVEWEKDAFKKIKKTISFNELDGLDISK